jgi:hypothetical protein
MKPKTHPPEYILGDATLDINKAVIKVCDEKCGTLSVVYLLKTGCWLE